MSQEELDMVEELCNVDSGLRPREMDFIEDLSEKDEDYELTDAQHNWLTDIHRRLT